MYILQNVFNHVHCFKFRGLALGLVISSECILVSTSSLQSFFVLFVIFNNLNFKVMWKIAALDLKYCITR